MLIAARNGFLAGKRILPPGARWVEYLESTGTQWIDTGIFPTDNTNFNIEVSDFVDGTIYGCLTGNRGSGYVTWSRFQFGRRDGIVGSNKLFYSFFLATYGTYESVSINYSLKHIFSLKTDGLYIDEVKVGSRGTDIITPLQTFFLFANHQLPESATEAALMAGSKCHHASFYNGSIILRDFRPIAIGTTGYMLDLVSGEYLPYGNKGTGNFVIGPDTNAPAI